MKRSRIVLLSLVLLLAALALPAFARADSTQVGWTWDDSAVNVEPPQYGWTWDEAVVPPADG
jgi:hypothetical protein